MENTQEDVDVYEVLVYYETPTYQVLHIQAPSAEAVVNMVKQQLDEGIANEEVLRYDIKRCAVIDPSTHVQ